MSLRVEGSTLLSKMFLTNYKDAISFSGTGFAVRLYNTAKPTMPGITYNLSYGIAYRVKEKTAISIGFSKLSFGQKSKRYDIVVGTNPDNLSPDYAGGEYTNRLNTSNIKFTLELNSRNTIFSFDQIVGIDLNLYNSFIIKSYDFISSNTSGEHDI